MSQDECEGTLFLGGKLSASVFFLLVLFKFFPGCIYLGRTGRQIQRQPSSWPSSSRGEKKSNALDKSDLRENLNSHRPGLLPIFNFFEALRPQSLPWSRSTRWRLCYYLLDAPRKTV